MQRETEVMSAWIKRLIEIQQLLDNSEGEAKIAWQNYLLGYIASAKEFYEYD